MESITEDFIRRGSKRQILACFLLAVVSLSVPFEHVLVNFLAPYLDFWCDIEDISHCPRNFQIQLITESNHYLGSIDQCFVTKMNWTQFNSCNTSAPHIGFSSNSLQKKCSSGFKFDLKGMESTVTSTFSLVCDRLWLLEIISPLYATSLIFGALLSGLADLFGRKRCLMIFTLLHIIGGFISAFGTNVLLFIFGRMLIAVAVRGIGICCLILIIEIFPSKRIQFGSWLYIITYATGGPIAALIAFFIRDYQWLQLAASLPFCLIFLCWYAIPESPSWLISKNKIEDATAELKILAKSGGYLDEIEYKLECTSLFGKEKISFGDSLTFLDLFKHRSLFFYSIAIITIIITCSLTNLGVTFNMGLIFGNIYINILSCGLIECISLLIVGIFTIQLRRRLYLLITLSLLFSCHILSFSFSFFQELKTALTITTLGAKVITLIIGVVVNVYSGELFPTPIRQRARGFCHAVAGVATIFSSLIGGKLKLIWAPAPFIIFSSMTILSLLVAFFLPETKGRPLPQNLDDVLKLGEVKAGNNTEDL